MGYLLLLILVGVAVYFFLRRPKAALPTALQGSVRLDAPPASRGTARALASRATPAAWIPPGHRVDVQGIAVTGGMIYVGGRLPSANGLRSADPALIDPSLPVAAAHPSYSAGMGYWPSYSDVGAHNRGAYLMWLSGGRREPSAYIGYVFLFFYGLERRALVDRADVPALRAEVGRLLSIYSGNNSFRGYATDFLAFTLLDNLASVDEATVRSELGEFVATNANAMASLLAWYHMHRRPLPADFAAAVASSMDEAKRSVVAKRSRQELLDLFALRYREKYGDGIVLDAAARPKVIPYRPASAGLLATAHGYVARVPDVLGKPKQLKPLVGIWNACLEDLKRFASAQRKAGAEASVALTAEMWEAMPPDLRAQHDHPDKDRWDEVILSAPRIGERPLMTAKALAELGRLPQRDRYTAGQMRKLADTAAVLGFAIEPDPRAAPSGAAEDARFAVWRSSNTSAPDPHLYGPVSTVLKLAVHIAAADKHVSEEELAVMTTLLETLFILDDAMRERVEALRDVLALQPAKIGPLTKKLAETRTPEQRAVIGRLLVAIAGADGTIGAPEHKALRGLYKSLDLAPSALDAAIAASGARLATDQPVTVVAGRPAAKGSAVTPPSDVAGPRVQLDQRAIDAILADTREVAALLADVLDSADDEGGVEAAPASRERAREGKPAAPPPAASTAIGGPPAAASGAWTALTASLDPRYRPAFDELITRETWSASDAQALAARLRLMPGAIIDTINGWSDEALGDYLIVDEGHWTIRTDLLPKDAQ
ncbi:TerB N-terminal domain-containing protein [Sorangium sp. So ce1024]